MYIVTAFRTDIKRVVDAAVFRTRSEANCELSDMVDRHRLTYMQENMAINSYLKVNEVNEDRVDLWEVEQDGIFLSGKMISIIHFGIAYVSGMQLPMVSNIQSLNIVPECPGLPSPSLVPAPLKASHGIVKDLGMPQDVFEELLNALKLRRKILAERDC